MNGSSNTEATDGRGAPSLTLHDDDLKVFHDDVSSLWCQPNIPVLDGPPTSLLFLRDFVSRSRPCIIRNALLDDTQQKPFHMDLDDICEVVEDPTKNNLIVDVTPDGHGDCIRSAMDPDEASSRSRIFVKPLEHPMSILEFRDKLRQPKTTDQSIYSSAELMMGIHTMDAEEGLKTLPLHDVTGDDGTLEIPNDAVYYYSRQDDCLRKEFQEISSMIPETFSWAEEAFGNGGPDAINLWIGNEQCVSSMHKDHYENLFYVASGEKVFTICPPSDAPFLYESEFDSGQFTVNEDGDWCVSKETGNKVRWIEPNVQDLLEPTKRTLSLLSKFPLIKNTHPTQIRVRAGEMLYLPSLWFHRVTQSCETVGINYWFDMNFDSPSWCYFHLLQQMRPVPSAGKLTRIDSSDSDEEVQVPYLEGGYQTERLTWSKVVDIVESKNYARLSRSEEQQLHYEKAKKKLMRGWQSLYDRILHEKFGFDRIQVTTSTGKLAWGTHPPLSECKESRKVLVVNDFPYYLESNIVHYILWKIVEDITPSDINEAKEELKSKMPVNEILHWENPPYLKSLPDIYHVHFLCLLS